MADKLGVGTFRVERVIIPSTFILLETSEHKKLNNHRAKHRSRVRFLSRFCCDLACVLHFVIVQPKAGYCIVERFREEHIYENS